MENKDLAAAFRKFQQGMEAACAELVEVLTQQTPQIDPITIATVKTQFVDCKAGLAGLMLFPLTYESLEGKLPWLFHMYLQCAGAAQETRELTKHRQLQRRTVINATKRLILRGESFRLAEVGRESGIDTAVYTRLFADGFNEIREIALGELTTEAFRLAKILPTDG